MNINYAQLRIGFMPANGRELGSWNSIKHYIWFSKWKEMFGTKTNTCSLAATLLQTEGTKPKQIEKKFMALFEFLKRKENMNSDTLTPKVCSTNIPMEITEKIDNINWVDYETAYGNAEMTIPFYLKNLFCSDNGIALEATHQLWCSLCHQHAFISTASLPAYDILKIALLELDNKMKIEILDIFQGFAICTNNEYLNSLKENPEKWQLEIRQKLNADIKIFEEFRTNPDELISDFSNFIYENLKNENNWKKGSR